MANDDQLHFNGVNGDSGEYDLPPMTGEDLAGFIRGESPPENLSELRDKDRRKNQAVMGVVEGVDPKKLEEAGWGVIFAHDTDPAIKEALSELLNLRQEQAGEHFRLYEKGEGHRPGESKAKFLARHGAGPGPANPEKVPYYLLIVGDPESIPYRFQTQLDVQYAVGRIQFDTLDEYASYARSVVEAETKSLKLSRQISFFGVANPDDQATQLSAQHLVDPMFENFRSGQSTWNTTVARREEATKDQLARLLGGDQTPALLFTASHGMSFRNGSDRQLAHQGAILCQDWPGPRGWNGAIPQDHYFAGDDLSSDANLLGLIAFFFACYGGGTPRLDDFSKQAFRERSEIAPHSFLAPLPLKMLSQPKGGALAVIGHVERAWGYSFIWPGAGAQTDVFESTMRQLLDGYPVGAAVEYFNERYAELSTVLSDELEEIEFGKEVDPYELAGMWTANNDARGYAIIGDPAVRLPVAEAGEEASERPAITVQAAGKQAPAPEGTKSKKAAGAAEPAAAGSDFSAPEGSAEPTPAPTASHQITVTTYTAADAGNADGKSAAARSSFAFNGDLETVVSDEAAGNEQLLALHQALVQEAIAAR
ncbi:MAG: hypothetical protein JSW55_12165, partial [Chloroflexota bacterium]